MMDGEVDRETLECLAESAARRFFHSLDEGFSPAAFQLRSLPARERDAWVEAVRGTVETLSKWESTR